MRNAGEAAEGNFMLRIFIIVIAVIWANVGIAKVAGASDAHWRNTIPENTSYICAVDILGQLAVGYLVFEEQPLFIISSPFFGVRGGEPLNRDDAIYLQHLPSKEGVMHQPNNFDTLTFASNFDGVVAAWLMQVSTGAQSISIVMELATFGNTEAEAEKLDEIDNHIYCEILRTFPDE